VIFLVSKGHHSSRQVLEIKKNKIMMKEMQALKSQSHQKRKIKKILKYMLIFSNAPSTMNATVVKEMMTNINLILLMRIKKMSLKEMFHQEDLSQFGTKISFLASAFLAIILVI
jgi:hypothetical protein